MLTLVRAAFVVAVLVVLATAGAAALRAADPTPIAEPILGATVEGVMYADEDRTVSVLNRSNVEATFTFSAAQGWGVDPSQLTLLPGETADVHVAGIGADGAALDVRIAAVATPAPGAQRGEVLLTARLFTERPFDWMLLTFAIAFVLIASTVAAFVTLRGRKDRRVAT